jgi:hypothetical protein
MIVLSGVYRSIVTTGDRILPAGFKRAIKWEHPAGPKTIHFWAPFMKWVNYRSLFFYNSLNLKFYFKQKIRVW